MPNYLNIYYYICIVNNEKKVIKQLGRPPKYKKKLVVVTLQVPEGDKEKIQSAARKLREINLKPTKK
jgi:hypothetical protein